MLSYSETDWLSPQYNKHALSAFFKMCLVAQVEKQKGTSPEEMKNNSYYNEAAIVFVETVLVVLTLDAAYRYEVWLA